MKTKQSTRLGWLGSPLRAGVLTLALASALITGCVSPREANTANVSPVAAQSLQTRQKIAQAMFAERCKTAGEKIHRTVENVEGIFLMKLRPARDVDTQAAIDPYGRDLTGDGYIETFVRGSYDLMKSKNPRPGWPPRNGYAYVDAINPKDGQRYRYTGAVKAVGRMDPKAPNVQVDLKRDPNFDLNIYRFVMERTPTTAVMPRYGVTYDDISTPEEREYWIAGSSLKVIDLQTNEIVAERIGYMVDLAQGSKAGGRSPWLFAADHACPNFHRFQGVVFRDPAFSLQTWQTLDFVEKVLQSKLKYGN